MTSKVDFLAYFLQKSKEKNFDISSIRKEMVAAGQPEEEIKSVVNAIDEVLVQRAIAKNGPEWYQKLKASGFSLSGNGLLVIGGILIALGVVQTVISYFKYVAGYNEMFFIHYGPMIWGMFILLIGAARRSREKITTRRFELQDKRRNYLEQADPLDKRL
jgi:hypothetical protein